MSTRNSSLTRVKPLFDYINSDIEKLNRLLSLLDIDKKIEHDSLIEIRYGVNEKKIPPSKSLLIWMLKNLNELSKVKNYGTKSTDSETYEKRKLLFSGDKEKLDKALHEIQRNSKIPKNAWYIFEGYTSPDIFIETIDSIFVGEAKRTEKNITTKTTWLNPRDQLIRHIDSQLDQPKEIYSFYILEKQEYQKGVYKKSMDKYLEEAYFKSNLKHRNESDILRAFKSYHKYIFWEDIADCFDISFPDKK